MKATATLLALALLALSAWPAAAQETWKTIPPPAAMPRPAEAGRVAHDGAQIYYQVFGKGPAIVLLHGGLSHGDVWGNQVPVFAQAHRVIVIDSRGHGRSSRDSRPYTYELMASDVLAVMDHLKVERAAIVGWSDGGIIGLVLAMKHPERLTKVFALAANTDPSGVDLGAMQNPVFAGFMAMAEAEYRRLSPTPDGFAAFTAAIEKMWASEPNYTAADLARIKVPVAIVAGEHDEAIKRAHTDYMAASIPGATKIILGGVSHFAVLQEPDLFNRTVLEFLDPPVRIAR